MTGERMGRTPSVGDGNIRSKPREGQATKKRLKQSLLAAVQMIRARDIDDHAIRRINCDDGRDALKKPQAQSLKGLMITHRIRRFNAQVRNDCLCLADRHSDAESLTNGQLAGRRDHAAVANTSCKNERRLS